MRIIDYRPIIKPCIVHGSYDISISERRWRHIISRIWCIISPFQYSVFINLTDFQHRFTYTYLNLVISILRLNSTLQYLLSIHVLYYYTGVRSNNKGVDFEKYFQMYCLPNMFFTNNQKPEFKTIHYGSKKLVSYFFKTLYEQFLL